MPIQIIGLGKVFCVVWVSILFTGCATYYQKNLHFREAFVKGDIEEANKILEKNKKAALDKNRLLYRLQKGTTEQMLGNYTESNVQFEDAYIFLEDYKKRAGTEVASLVTNPNLKPYTGEDFEKVLIHYYKALNYLRLQQTDEALVECRRINIKLNDINDKYEKRKNTYKRDAFALNLMGIIYETSGDHNNAFIAYKNAYSAYAEDYKTHFGVSIPEQLKKDLLRSAYMNNFSDELSHFEKLFGIKYQHQLNEGGELVFFWHNGMGPVKDEWSINFFIVKGQGGVVMFVNEELGLSFPFPLPASGATQGGIGDLKFVRVAFPKYVERKTYYRTASLTVNDRKYPLETGQNINEIAFKTLQDRMNRELANSLMRLALKQAAEYKTNQVNQNLGALLSVANAISEKADTRNWQVLPYSIHYARIPLAEGKSTVNLQASSPKNSRQFNENFNFEVKKGETIFHLYHNLESIPLEY